MRRLRNGSGKEEEDEEEDIGKEENRRGEEYSIR
jgi:hypothetical protein